MTIRLIACIAATALAFGGVAGVADARAKHEHHHAKKSLKPESFDGSCEFSGGTPEPLTPQQNAWRTEAIPVTLALMATGSFSVEGGPTFPLAEAAEAHRTGQAGARGKIVLLP